MPKKSQINEYSDSYQLNQFMSIERSLAICAALVGSQEEKYIALATYVSRF